MFFDPFDQSVPVNEAEDAVLIGEAMSLDCLVRRTPSIWTSPIGMTGFIGYDVRRHPGRGYTATLSAHNETTKASLT